MKARIVVSASSSNDAIDICHFPSHEEDLAYEQLS